MDAENWVVKSNALIESKGKLTALERKIFLGLVSEVKIGDKDFKNYELDITNFKKLVDSNAKNFYSEVESACKSLTSRNITLKTILVENGKKKNVIESMSYLAYAKYKTGDMSIQVQIAPALVPYLLELQTEFTKYQLKNVLAMRSTHAIKIYELVKQYQNTEQKKRTLELKDLKEFLGIAEKYSAFKDFEKYVLKVAEKEISEHTDIVLTYKKIKRGRTIHSIEFQIFEKNKIYKTEFEETFLEFQEQGLNLDNAKKIRQRISLPDSFSDMQICELYEIACERVSELEHIDPFQYMNLNFYYTLSKNPKNKFAYYKKAVEDDYAKACITLAKKNRL